jgi:hypothetical protein
VRKSTRGSEFVVLSSLKEFEIDTDKEEVEEVDITCWLKIGSKPLVISISLTGSEKKYKEEEDEFVSAKLLQKPMVQCHCMTESGRLPQIDIEFNRVTHSLHG